LSLQITAGNVSASGTIYTYDVEVTISVTPITMDYGDSALVTVSYVAGVAPAGGTYVGLETVDGVTPDCYYYLPGEVYIAPGQASGSVVLETFVSPPLQLSDVVSACGVGTTEITMNVGFSPTNLSSASNVGDIGVTITQLDYGTQTTTDLVSETLYYWNSGDAIPAGTYRVEYVSGWWRPYTGNSNHCVQHSYAAVGPFIKYNNGSASLRAPGIVGDYSTSAACEAANAGSYANFTHTGGTIAVFLYDTDHSLNDGPGITVRLRRLS
jgi:hypothetical protein